MYFFRHLMGQRSDFHYQTLPDCLLDFHRQFDCQEGLFLFSDGFSYYNRGGSNRRSNISIYEKSCVHLTLIRFRNVGSFVYWFILFLLKQFMQTYKITQFVFIKLTVFSQRKLKHSVYKVSCLLFLHLQFLFFYV